MAKSISTIFFSTSVPIDYRSFEVKIQTKFIVSVAESLTKPETNVFVWSYVFSLVYTSKNTDDRVLIQFNAKPD